MLVVHLEHCRQVDDVELASAANRIADHVGVDVKAGLQCADKRLDVLRSQRRYDVDVIGGARESVQGTRERADHDVNDTESVQLGRHQSGDPGSVGRRFRQYPSRFGSQPKTWIISSGPSVTVPSRS